MHKQVIMPPRALAVNRCLRGSAKAVFPVLSLRRDGRRGSEVPRGKIFGQMGLPHRSLCCIVVCGRLSFGSGGIVSGCCGIAPRANRREGRSELAGAPRRAGGLSSASLFK
jgi:hypothetical protein